MENEDPRIYNAPLQEELLSTARYVFGKWKLGNFENTLPSLPKNAGGFSITQVELQTKHDDRFAQSYYMTARKRGPNMTRLCCKLIVLPSN